MGTHYSIEFKEKVLRDYFSGKFGGYRNVAKEYMINQNTLKNWIKKKNSRKPNK